MTVGAAVLGQTITVDWGNAVADAVNRHGCHIERSTNQTLPASTTTDATWPTETDDTDGYYTPTGSTVTIPTGLGGIYVISFSLDTDITSLSNLRVDISGSDHLFEPVGGESFAGSLVLPLAAADTVKLQVGNGAGAGNISDGFLSVYRLSI